MFLDQDYNNYLVQHVLTPFYDRRLMQLTQMRLIEVLKRKNPYLFRAKNIEFASDFVKSIIDAFLSSQEETMFGNLLEGFAIFVSSRIDNGFKSARNSLDLEFIRDNTYYIVGIKSGTNWGNSDQIRAMKDSFKKAKEDLRLNHSVALDIVAINGCMYGTETSSLKTDKKDVDKTYYKYAGQNFWSFISHDDNLYQTMIVPIGEEAKKKDEAFKLAYTSKVNELTTEFSNTFLTPENQIDWVKLLEFVSKRPSTPLKQTQLL